MKLEVRIPITPHANYVRQVEYLVRSFEANGGNAADTRFLVCIGGDCVPFDLEEAFPWSRGRVDWRWSSREEFKALSHRVNNLNRFRYETDADIVLLMDADTLLIRPIDDIVVALAQNPMIAGVMAHVPPFWQLPVTWQQVFAAAGKPMPSGRFTHTGFGTMFGESVNRFAPIYYNFGVVFVPGKWLTQIGAQLERELPATAPLPIHPVYAAQVALTFAIYALGAPHCALDFRFNFANLDWADRKYLMDLADVRVIHYLKEDVIGTRRGTWGSEEAFKAFLERADLAGSNEILRSALARLHAASVS